MTPSTNPHSNHHTQSQVYVRPASEHLFVCVCVCVSPAWQDECAVSSQKQEQIDKKHYKLNDLPTEQNLNCQIKISGLKEPTDILKIVQHIKNLKDLRNTFSKCWKVCLNLANASAASWNIRPSTYGRKESAVRNIFCVHTLMLIMCISACSVAVCLLAEWQCLLRKRQAPPSHTSKGCSFLFFGKFAHPVTKNGLSILAARREIHHQKEHIKLLFKPANTVQTHTHTHLHSHPRKTHSLYNAE